MTSQCIRIRASQDTSEIKPETQPGLAARSPKLSILIVGSTTSANDSVWSASRSPCAAATWQDYGIHRVTKSPTPSPCNGISYGLCLKDLSPCTRTVLSTAGQSSSTAGIFATQSDQSAPERTLKASLSIQTHLVTTSFWKPLQRSQKLVSCPQNYLCPWWLFWEHSEQENPISFLQRWKISHHEFSGHYTGELF